MEQWQEDQREGSSSSHLPRLALCHLESLVGLPALNILFNDLGQQIDLVLISSRFGGKHGGAVSQLVKGSRRWGLRLTLWLGLDIILAQLADRLDRASAFLGRQPRLRTVRALAREYGAVLIPTEDVNSSSINDLIRSHSIDIVVVMNFDQILRTDFIRSPRVGVINVHPSFLPNFRGPTPVFWTLFMGCETAGVSIHLINGPEIDAGPILLREAIPIVMPATVAGLTMTLFARGAGLVSRAIDRMSEGGAIGEVVPPRETYYGFPRAHEVREGARRGLKLFQVRHLFDLLGKVFA